MKNLKINETFESMEAAQAVYGTLIRAWTTSFDKTDKSVTIVELWPNNEEDYKELQERENNMPENPIYEELMAIKNSDRAEMEGNEEMAEFYKSIGE